MVIQGFSFEFFSRLEIFDIFFVWVSWFFFPVFLVFLMCWGRWWIEILFVLTNPMGLMMKQRPNWSIKHLEENSWHKNLYVTVKQAQMVVQVEAVKMQKEFAAHVTMSWIWWLLRMLTNEDSCSVCFMKSFTGNAFWEPTIGTHWENRAAMEWEAVVCFSSNTYWLNGEELHFPSFVL